MSCLLFIALRLCTLYITRIVRERLGSSVSSQQEVYITEMQELQSEHMFNFLSQCRARGN